MIVKTDLNIILLIMKYIWFNKIHIRGHLIKNIPKMHQIKVVYIEKYFNCEFRNQIPS